MKVSQGILRYLEINEVNYVFGISAGTVSGIFDGLNDVNIKPIISKNEAGAAYMAAKYASVSKKLGVCIAAGGVGTNNMVNGIADAMRSKVPVLVITGYVHRWQIGKGAIQELDTEPILRPITKYSKTILDEKQVLAQLKKAMEIALTPPYGPVHLSIPIDIQVGPLYEEIPDKIDPAALKHPFDQRTVDEACDIINREKNGIIMVGKGCRGLSKEVMALSEHLQWPIITTPEGKGGVYYDFHLNLGNYGFSGSETATDYVENSGATCLLVLGSSLGESATRNYNSVLVAGRKVIHVDWDEKELNKVFPADVAIHSDLAEVIPALIKGTNPAADKFQKEEILDPYQRNHTGLSIRLFLEKMTRLLPNNTYYVSDIGEYMNFVFKFLQLPPGAEFEISLNYGAMGSGVAGVVGVKLADPDRLTVVITGDGSFLMNGTEIFTAKENKLPILYFVINNAMMGYVEHGHTFLYGRSLEGFKQERISIAKMMEAAGVKAIAIDSYEGLDQIPEMVKDLKGPCVVELITDGSEPAPVADRFKALSDTKK